ncbi:MAG: nucleotidyltransferase family protein [Clostridiales bacterium]|nr:nucleotidyltransferase family protein [Clostridiales bacterium]
MKTAGIIAEYNPFHTGHAYQLRKLRELGAERIVAVMSGNTVQRGDLAVAEKHARAKAAVLNGADLVLCLPAPWSCAGANRFALGGVKILTALGCVDTLCFGSESGDVEAVKAAAAGENDERYPALLKEGLDSGITFAAARERALNILCPNAAGVLRSSNDILGVEYVKAIQTLGSDLVPLAVKRQGAGHDGPASGGFSSAGEIREHLFAGAFPEEYLPSAEILNAEIAAGRAPVSLKNIERAVLCALRRFSPEDIARAPDVSEGIENRIYSALRTAVTLDELYDAAKTKRFTHARIRRIVLNAFLGITEELSAGLPPYIQALALNDTGKDILRQAKDSCSLPIVMRTADVHMLGAGAKRVFETECSVADMFTMAMPTPRSCGSEQVSNVILL